MKYGSMMIVFAALCGLLLAISAPALADTVLTGNSWLYYDAGASVGKLRNAGGDVMTATTAAVGSQADPYVFNVAGNLDLHGYNISGASSSAVAQYSATWQVDGSVLNTAGGGSDGSFYSHTTQNVTPGGVRVEAGGSIDVKNAWTYAFYAPAGGNLYLWAKDGKMQAAGTLDSHSHVYDNHAGAITVRSEGAVANQGIKVDGVVGGYSIRTYDTDEKYSAPVALYTQGNVDLAGGINAAKGTGNVTIRGDVTDTSLRAGDVKIGGDVNTSSASTYYSAGKVTVLANSLEVNGKIDGSASSYAGHGGNIDVDVLGTAMVTGYIDAHTTSTGYDAGAPGWVKILGKHIVISGVDGSGRSIMTNPVYVGPSWNNMSVANNGDANVTLTGTDSSTLFYDPLIPLTGDTSSISVAGKIETGYGNWSNYGGSGHFDGDVYVYAVEVQLGDDITTEDATFSNIDVHYGVTTYGVWTHLMEDGLYWDGVGGHNIAYGVGPVAFIADVPYAGPVVVAPEPAGLSLLGLALLAIRRRRS